jgi:hypothetical protein
METLVHRTVETQHAASLMNLPEIGQTAAKIWKEYRTVKLNKIKHDDEP